MLFSFFMKYRKIKITHPWTYSFVRGTSVENALDLIDSAEHEKANPSYLDEAYFHVYAHPSFSGNYNPYFSDLKVNFGARKERDNKLPAKYFAGEHAFQDHLAGVFSEVYSLSAPPEFFPFYQRNISFEKETPDSFYNAHARTLMNNGMHYGKVSEAFRNARDFKGVLIYFNESLLEYIVAPDNNRNQHHRFNSVLISSDNPVPFECIKAIEPLSSFDREKLEKTIPDLRKKYK